MVNRLYEATGKKYGVEQIRGAIAVNQTDVKDFFDLQVTGTDPAFCTELMDEIIDVFPDYLRSKSSTLGISLVNYPTNPTVNNSDNSVKVAFAAFLAGAFLSENFDNLITICKKYWWIFLILSAVFEFTNFDLGRYGILKTLCLAPAMFGFAYALPKLNIKYDITYGLYLYHMIAVNIFVHLGLKGQYWQMLAALAITVVAASISYALIGRFYRNKKKKNIGNL